jgi:5'-nucleotidase
LSIFILLKCSGEKLYQALENAVSQYPKSEGRFPQVAGIEFAFDPSNPTGKRIDHKAVKVKNEYLLMEKEYKLATKIYLKNGNDGFSMLMNTHEIICEEEGPQLFTMVENYFNRVAQSSSEKVCPKLDGRIKVIKS